MLSASPVRQRVTTTLFALSLLVLTAAAPRAAAQTPDAFAARVMSARNDGGANPQRALAALRALRQEAVAGNALDRRLLVDEAECRVLTDFDAPAAIAVADAGLALAGANPASPAREAWLRLRACRAGMWVEAGDVAGGRAEFERLIELTAAESDASVRALVRTERGLHRSRSGDWTGAQQDLLAACNTLRETGPARDHELCLGHLANHYKRIGDADEALRLLQGLSTEARHRGAVYDDSIYTFGIGQVLHEQQRWQDAITKFDEAIQANRRLGDDNGIAYAEHAIAVSLLRLGRPQESLQAVERSLGRLDAKGDPREYQVTLITRAEALAGLGRAAEANAVLDSVAGELRRRGEKPSLMLWHSVRADAMRQLGRWNEAYLALAEARRVDADLQRQRLSEQSARVRMQFNRARDAEELSALRQLNEQSQRLRQTQAVALGLFVILLAVVLVVAVRKFRQARHLQNLASTDDLTGLPNRRALLAYADDAIAQAQRDATPLAMLMIDVDHFKRINDGHGHAVGDQVLRHVARVLASGLRGRDRLGRLGGEEFLAVLPGASVAQAQQVAERMRHAIERTPLIGASGEVRFTVSIGVAGAQIAETAAALVARADAALYRAKNGGRNAVVADDGAAGPLSAA
jgi:diguanylate cyclase (GGDEF)-like protein